MKNILIVATGGVGWRGWVKKVKGLRSPDWSVQNNHGGVKYNSGNMVNNILKAMCGVGRVRDFWGRSLGKLYV